MSYQLYFYPFYLNAFYTLSENVYFLLNIDGHANAHHIATANRCKRISTYTTILSVGLTFPKKSNPLNNSISRSIINYNNFNYLS